MKNPYETHPIIITNIENQNPLVKVFTLQIENINKGIFSRNSKKIINYWKPGQFIAISIPGFGEAPFVICSIPTSQNKFQICVQNKGVLTNKLFNLSSGDRIYFRGPYGNGFSIEKLSKKNLLIIAGGLGLVPLRPLIEIIINDPSEFKKVQLFSGSREEKMMLFKNEHKIWSKNIELNLTIDTPNENWSGSTGLITTLFDKTKIDKNSTAIICGPPIMYKPVIKKLLKKKIKESDIYVMLERRMHCGIGICQHCVLVNGKYVCKDGPIFNYAELKTSPESI